MILTLGAHPICDPVNWPHMCVLAHAPTCTKCVTSWQVFTFLIAVMQANMQKGGDRTFARNWERIKISLKETEPARGFMCLNPLSAARFIRIRNHPSTLRFIGSHTWRVRNTCTCQTRLPGCLSEGLTSRQQDTSGRGVNRAPGARRAGGRAEREPPQVHR